METWAGRAGGYKMLSEGPEVKIIIIIMLRYCLVSFFTVLTFAPVVQKALVGESKITSNPLFITKTQL